MKSSKDGRPGADRAISGTPSLSGEPVLEVKNISGKGRFENVSFSVRAGEIVGVSGLMGAGRTEMMRAIFGLDPLDSGEIWVRGKKVAIKKPDDAVKHGIGFITEDRKDEGLVLDFSVRENMAAAQSVQLLFQRVHLREEGTGVRGYVDEAVRRSRRIHPRRWHAICLVVTNRRSLLLSGSALGRACSSWMSRHGVDVGAKREIYQLMNELTERGVAILMVSSGAGGARNERPDSRCSRRQNFR